MPRQPSREKTQRFRLRQAGDLPALPTCPQCGRTVISDRTAPLCSRCWKLTPEGRAADAERKRQARKRDAV
jgi:ribosomal protein L32